MGISGNEAGRMIANANSIIKVCQVLLMLPFTPLLVKATYFIIRGNDEEDKKFELAYHQLETCDVPRRLQFCRLSVRWSVWHRWQRPT